MTNGGKRTAIDVVEVAYRSAATRSDQWLDDVIKEMHPLLDRGERVFAYEYDSTRAYTDWVSHVVSPKDPAFASAIKPAFLSTPRWLNEWIHKREGAVTILSEMLGRMAPEHDQMGPIAAPHRIGDIFGLNATDPSGLGTYFCATTNRPIARARVDTPKWEQLAAHLATAARLRRVLGARAEPDAVLSPTGAVLHASREAQTGLEALARSARAIDRSRTRARRREPEALASWRALVDGRWSLVDVVESDGRRVLFAVPNSPSVRDPRRLTPRERLIAGYIAMAHSNKLIAYELGMSVGAVAAQTHAILKKLGLRRRVELIDRIALLDRGTTTRFDVGPGLVAVSAKPQRVSGADPLTAAERQVALMAARGQSSAAIAAKRNVSHRTVSNQLASIFTKLKVESRSELAVLLAGARRR